VKRKRINKTPTPISNTHLKHHLRSDPESCHHFRFGLRGCTLTQGHTGPHTNGFSRDGAWWSDEDGMYVNTREDWSALVQMAK
jgi:hypothetical protein